MGALGNMTYTCHAGSTVGEYKCTTNLVNCTGAVNLNKCAELPVVLGNAGAYSVLAGSLVTNSGLTKVLGDLGTSPGKSVTGFEPAGQGEMLGASSIKTADDAATGIADLTTAYNDAAGRVTCPTITKIGELGGMTLAPGRYTSTSGMEVTGDDLILDGGHDGEAVWIFQMASTFTSAVSKKIILINGAKASNVFWQVGTSGTIGATSTFEGTMMADQDITLGTGAIVNGRVLARIAGVTLLANAITIPHRGGRAVARGTRPASGTADTQGGEANALHLKGRVCSVLNLIESETDSDIESHSLRTHHWDESLKNTCAHRRRYGRISVNTCHPVQCIGCHDPWTTATNNTTPCVPSSRSRPQPACAELPQLLSQVPPPRSLYIPSLGIESVCLKLRLRGGVLLTGLSVQ
eukprot:1301159-Rhodomonas_salina.3